MSEIRKISPAERHEADPTPGMVRELAFATERLWAGLVRTAPGSASGWHHHGENETAIYVLSGHVRFEFGPAGAAAVTASAGDFVLVPQAVVHRETNPSDEESQLVLIRAVSGPPTVNVEGPR